jgi:hypothetical protein
MARQRQPLELVCDGAARFRDMEFGSCVILITHPESHIRTSPLLLDLNFVIFVSPDWAS